MSDSPHLAYVGDGRNYHVQKWLPALVRAGIRVSLISYDAPDHDLMGVEFIPLRGRIRSKATYLDYVRPARILRQAIASSGSDVVMGSYATHYGFLAARTGFRPFIMQTWTGDLSVYPFEGSKRLWYHPVVRYGLSRADLITTDGSALLEIGRRLYPDVADKMVATRWGIDATAVDNGTRAADLASHRVVTSPRGLQHWYEPELVLSAMLDLLAREGRVFVIILTLGHARSANVQRYLDELEEHPRARVIDRFLDQSEMADLWHSTDIVVSIPHADGISESVLEAAYAGAYPVLSDIPSNRSLMDDGLSVRILADRTREGLIAAIREDLETRPDVIAHRERHNRAWVLAHATVDATATELAQEIRRLAVEKRRD